MLRSLFEVAASLVFPVECETCSVTLSPLPPVGVCARCEAEIKWVNAPHCVSCGRTLRNETSKCAECLDEKFYFDRAFACALYEGKMKELLHAYKFGRRKYLGNFFIKAMEKFMNAHVKPGTFDAVVAVPMDKIKRNERGFNQSALLSARLAKKLNVPHYSKKLRRAYSSTPQSLLTKTDRKLNVRGRFSVASNVLLHGKRILLVDDILTTGQTASECARVLKEAGASTVTVLACARGA